MEKGKKILEPRNAPVLRSSAGRSRGWGRQGGSCGQICGPEWAIGLCPLTTPRPARTHEQDEPAHHHMKPLLELELPGVFVFFWWSWCILIS